MEEVFTTTASIAVTVVVVSVIYGLYLFLLDMRNERYIRADDNKLYKVKGSNYHELKERANVLAYLNKVSHDIINHLHELKGSKKMEEIRHNIHLLKSRYSRKHLQENLDEVVTSYTINKQNIHLCLISKDTSKIHTKNELIFVMIHELAHVGSSSYGHTEEFIEFFVVLLVTAIKLKIYKYIDYTKTPTEYCGITLNETPLNEKVIKYYTDKYL